MRTLKPREPLGRVSTAQRMPRGLQLGSARSIQDATAPRSFTAMRPLWAWQKMRFAAENFTDCLKGEEGMEGVASFLEKRKPNWHQEGEA